jgi:hypothetical protein
MNAKRVMELLKTDPLEGASDQKKAKGGKNKQ